MDAVKTIYKAKNLVPKSIIKKNLRNSQAEQSYIH